MGRDSDRFPGAKIQHVDVTGEQGLRDRGPDVIETGPRREQLPRPVRLVALGILLLAAVAVAVYAIGRHDSGSVAPSPPHPSTSSALPNVNDIVTATGNRCAVQLGDQLQLGVEILNRSAGPVTLQQVKADLPLGGLRPAASTWGSCGQLPALPSVPGHVLPAGATMWLTITFDVLMPCPGALPVLFDLTYTQDGRAGTSNPGGFSDLGSVPYSRCVPGSS